MNAESLLLILGELLAKSTVILLLAPLIMRLWPGATAAQRHFVWLAAIVTLLLLPATRLFTPRWPIPLQQAAITQLPALPELTAPILLSETAPAPLPPAPHPTTHQPLDWQKLLIRGWLGGAAFLLGYRLLGMRRLHRLKRSSARLRDERIQNLARAVFLELKIERPVDVCMAEECHVPMTWGSVQSVLLLPAEAVLWSDSRVRAALRHEASHILRRDYLVRWLASLAGAIYWPNPLIWLAIRSLRSAQEQATDDLVLRAGTPPDEYATQLFETARTLGTRGLFTRHAVAMANPSTLEARVVAILDGRRARRPLNRRTAIIGSLVIAGTLALCEAAQLQGAEQSPATPAEGTDPSGAAESKSAEPAPSPAAARDISADPTLELSPIRMEEVTDEQSARRFVLHIPIKLRPGRKVNVNDLVIHVLFYDLIDGQTVVQTAANVSSHWTKPPADWTKGDTEELAVEYQLPKSQAATHDGGPRQYFGYVVRVYYQRRLQAADADPLRLTQQYPPPARLPAPPGPAHPAAADASVPVAAPGAAAAPLITKEWKLPRGVISTPNHDARELLTAHGVKFPTGASALYIVNGDRLIVRDTEDQLDLVDQLVAQASEHLPPANASEGATAATTPGAENPVLARAAAIIIPKIELKDATVPEALDFLQKKAAEFDPRKTGIDIICRPGAGGNAKITLSLANIPLLEAVRYVAALANLPLRAEGDALLIGPVEAPKAAQAITTAVAITLASNKAFKDGDGIEIRNVSGSSPTFRVGGTYRVQGVCRQNTVANASLYLGDTAEGSEDAIKPVAGTSLFKAVPKGATEFEFTFTPLRPGKIHVTIYDLDNHDPKDNAYAGLYLGEVSP